MDELEFRRRAYADPQDQDKAFVDALAEEAGRKEFVDELRALDDRLSAAMKISPPEDLANRILLHQSLSQFQHQRKRQRLHLAAAASIAFVIGLSLTLTRKPATLGEHALAHVAHEAGFADRVDERVSLTALNTKLASFGGRMDSAPGHIYYANYCDFDGIRSLHMVVDTSEGKMTVFFVPKEQNKAMTLSFGNDRYEGAAFDLGPFQVAVVGGRNQRLDPTVSQLKDTIHSI
ncbi:DUF3379 domain-containing protein [Ferrimonas sediminicola]|uniref:DUF3379 domain-containing protein n=1 Tax=Ferrimonas sediminicola TaxID=2569538 RepID=A0A4U1BGI2_9GAMM|nr:DUF3379 domain-containing protein [Ferrimonas sediminicola]TKB49822.1 DUF3379 domain-containing protein [Ferrimonas sediminicola]